MNQFYTILKHPILTAMALKNQILDMTPMGMKFTVLQTGMDTNGGSLDLHWELFPGCNMKDPLVHTHPNAIETYEVLEGEMEFLIRNEWVLAKKGDKLSVPKGVKHSFRNPSPGIVTVFNTHQPALKMENYFEDVCKVLDKLTDNRKKDFRMNLKGMLYMGVLMNRYRNEIIAKSPPDTMIKIFSAVGNLLRLNY